jgi:hypothetical protein
VAFEENEMIDVIRVTPRGVGSNAGWASLVTGQYVDFGPDLSLFTQSRADAYRLVDWVTPTLEEQREIAAVCDPENQHRVKRVDRAKVDYRDFEPNWLQVKLIVEEEHRAVLERLSEAVTIRDGYLDEALIKWAIDPSNNRHVAKGYQFIHRLEAVRAEQQGAPA